MRDDLVKKALGVVARELNIPTADLSAGKRLREDLGMDSIIALNIIFTAEKELGILLREEEVVEIRTVADLVNLVQRTVAAGRPSNGAP